MRAKFAFMVALLFISAQMLAISGASKPYVTLSEPYNVTVYNNGSVYLGKVGPGQTFYVTISSTTLNATGTSITRGWNELLASQVPSGWVVQNSSEYTSNLSVYIKPSPNALNGSYSFYLTAVNLGNYSKLGAVRFTAYINVTPDVFALDVEPRNISVDPGAPAYIQVQINNTGVSDNPFTISSADLPGWNSTETVFALHHTSKSFVYPVYEDTPGLYKTLITVQSESSPLVQKEIPVNLVVKRSALNDYTALGQGSLVFPAVEAPAYSIMYIISLLLKH